MKESSAMFIPNLKNRSTSIPAAAVALRQLMQDSINDGLAEAMRQRKRDNEIAAAVNQLRRCDNDGFFPTPAALAAEVAEVAGLPRNPQEDFSVLEPSAGIGSLCDAVRERSPSVKITAVERLIDAAAVCELKGYQTIQGDFFEQSPAVLGTFDRIVMNPPFEARRDIDHVRHAWDFLKPGGRLVAIMSESAFSGSILKQVEFRAWLESETVYSTHVRKEAFAERDAFRRTGVSVRILIADKRRNY